MSTTTNPRDISALLALNTYQGMTDEEIEILIDYRVRQKRLEEDIATKNANTEREINERLAIDAAAAQQVQTMVQSILSKSVAIAPVVAAQTVQPTLITNDSTEV